MKKKLGALVLTLASLAISAACASSGTSSRSKTPQPDPAESWASARSTELPGRSAHAAAVPTSRLATR